MACRLRIPHRTLGRVLMGARVAEVDEDPVAHELRDKAVVAPDRRAAPVLERRDDIAQIFGVHPGRERGRSHQVAKHHGQLATFGIGHRGRRDGRQVALGRKGDRLLSVPQGRQRLRQRHGLASGRAPAREMATEIKGRGRPTRSSGGRSIG
jgi:hypothetical protein